MDIYGYKKLFNNTEANIKFKRVSVENQLFDAAIIIKTMF